MPMAEVAYWRIHYARLAVALMFVAVVVGGIIPAITAVGLVPTSVFLVALPAATLSLFAVSWSGKFTEDRPWVRLGIGPAVMSLLIQTIPLLGDAAIGFLILPTAVGWPSFILAALLSKAFTPAHRTGSYVLAAKRPGSDVALDEANHDDSP